MAIKHKTIKASGDVGLASEWNDNHVVDDDVDFLQHQILNHVIENRTDFPAGPVEGQVIWRSDLNLLYVYDGAAWVNVLANVGDKCSVGRSGAQTIPHNVGTLIEFNTEYYDTNDMHSNVTNNTRVTIKKTGYYMVCGQVTFSPNAVGRRTVIIKKNAGYGWAKNEESSPSGVYETNINFVIIMNLNEGDYLTLEVGQTSGGNLTIYETEYYTFFNVVEML